MTSRKQPRASDSPSPPSVWWQPPASLQHTRPPRTQECNLPDLSAEQQRTPLPPRRLSLFMSLLLFWYDAKLLPGVVTEAVLWSACHLHPFPVFNLSLSTLSCSCTDLDSFRVCLPHLKECGPTKYDSSCNNELKINQTKKLFNLSGMNSSFWNVKIVLSYLIGSWIFLGLLDKTTFIWIILNIFIHFLTS